MLANMAISLILHKKISTTVAKAKALRKYVEPLITKSKTDSTHSRRVVFSYLQDKEAVSLLFSEISEKVADRPGGYTRILKTGNRLGDNAEMSIIELVDYNESLLTEAAPAKAKTRRSRRSNKPAETESTVISDAVVVEDEQSADEASSEVEVAAEDVVAEAESADSEAQDAPEESDENKKEEEK